MLLISISSHVSYSILKTLHTKDSSQAQYRREVRPNWLTYNVRRTNKEIKDQREIERERADKLCNWKKSKNKHTPFFKIIMKKYKQFYKYSYCVINHLH